MSEMLMLDTNAVSALVRGNGPALAARIEKQPFRLSVLVEAELRYGLARRPVSAGIRRLVESLLGGADIRPWTSDCAVACAALRSSMEASGQPLAALDFLIAAHAIADGCTLVSADRAFAQVPGLALWNWTSDA